MKSLCGHFVATFALLILAPAVVGVPSASATGEDDVAPHGGAREARGPGSGLEPASGRVVGSGTAGIDPLPRGRGGTARSVTNDELEPPSDRVHPATRLSAEVPDAIRRYEAPIVEAALEFAVEPALIAAIMQVESGGNPRAVSHAGALGLMQVMPGWFRPGEDPFDPATNIQRGAYVYRHGLDVVGDEALALAAYVGGVHQVRVGGNVPSWAAGYVRDVQSFRARFTSPETLGDASDATAGRSMR